MIEEIPFGNSCHNPDCEEPTEQDMFAICIDNEPFCSVDCAREYLNASSSAPETVILHDPQYQIERDKLHADFSEEDMGIVHDVTGVEEAVEIIDKFEDARVEL